MTAAATEARRASELRRNRLRALAKRDLVEREEELRDLLYRLGKEGVRMYEAEGEEPSPLDATTPEPPPWAGPRDAWREGWSQAREMRAALEAAMEKGG